MSSKRFSVVKRYQVFCCKNSCSFFQHFLTKLPCTSENKFLRLTGYDFFHIALILFKKLWWDVLFLLHNSCTVVAVVSVIWMVTSFGSIKIQSEIWNSEPKCAWFLTELLLMYFVARKIGTRQPIWQNNKLSNPR